LIAHTKWNFSKSGTGNKFTDAHKSKPMYSKSLLHRAPKLSKIYNKKNTSNPTCYILVECLY